MAELFRLVKYYNLPRLCKVFYLHTEKTYILKCCSASMWDFNPAFERTSLVKRVVGSIWASQGMWPNRFGQKKTCTVFHSFHQCSRSWLKIWNLVESQNHLIALINIKFRETKDFKLVFSSSLQPDSVCSFLFPWGDLLNLVPTGKGILDRRRSTASIMMKI